MKLYKLEASNWKAFFGTPDEPIKRDVITINTADEYYFSGYKAKEIQTNISKVMNSLN